MTATEKTRMVDTAPYVQRIRIAAAKLPRPRLEKFVSDLVVQLRAECRDRGVDSRPVLIEIRNLVVEESVRVRGHRPTQSAMLESIWEKLRAASRGS